jgi:hypothetical protein
LVYSGGIRDQHRSEIGIGYVQEIGGKWGDNYARGRAQVSPGGGQPMPLPSPYAFPKPPCFLAHNVKLPKRNAS